MFLCSKMFLYFKLTRLMTTCLTVFCCLLMLIALSPPSKADATADVQQTLQAMYDAQDAAILQHDIDNTMTPYAEDALFLDDVTGKESASLAGVRKGWLELFQSPTEKVTKISREIKTITLSKTHKSATLLTLHRISMSVTTRSGKVVPLEVDEQTRHYWVKGENGWQIEQERLMSIDTYRDGKLVRHNHTPVTS